MATWLMLTFWSLIHLRFLHLAHQVIPQLNSLHRMVDELVSKHMSY